MYSFCVEAGLGARLSELYQFTLVLAGLVHDAHHPGLTAGFLIHAATEFDANGPASRTLALTYNDQSPLEHMHLATTFALLAQRSNAFFDRPTIAKIRRPLVKAVLGTDMALHARSMTRLAALVDNLRQDDELAGSVVPWYFPDSPPAVSSALWPEEKQEKKEEWLSQPGPHKGHCREFDGVR